MEEELPLKLTREDILNPRNNLLYNPTPLSQDDIDAGNLRLVGKSKGQFVYS